VYELNIAIFDESNPSQVKDISAEVKAEGNEHLFCFTPAGASVSIVITDSDGNFPLGLRSQWTAGGPSSGSVQIKLKHQPDGQKNGTCAPGATDLQLDFVAVVR
jgi:hypothetical protein